MSNDEDKNLNGIMDSEEVELDEMTEALIDTGEAKGSETSEAAESNESEVEVSDEAQAPAVAEEESETEESLDEVVVEVEPLTVALTFGEEVVNVVVDEEFQLSLRKVCNDQGSRFDEFEVEGDLSPENLRLLMKALK